MANVNIEKIVVGGRDKTKIYHKVVTGDTYQNTAFTTDDLVAYLSDLGEMGSSKDTTEIKLYHLEKTAKMNTSETCKDISFTEQLTTDALEKMRDIYDKNSFMVTGIFDSAGKLIYGAYGQISDWGLTVPNQDVATLTYTMTVSDDRVKCTAPAESV